MDAQLPDPNASCLCGSGRALVACCATRFAADMAAWRQAQEAEHRLAKSIAEYALQTCGWDLFARALRLFSTQSDSSRAPAIAMPVFDRWFAFTWIANPDPDDEDIEVPDTWPTASLGLSWLASGAATVSSFDQAFIVRAADSPYSAFQVEAVRHALRTDRPAARLRRTAVDDTGGADGDGLGVGSL